MSQIELILISIYHLTGGEIRQVEFEQVVVESYRLFPDVFQLKGFPNFPDSAQIEKRIYDKLKPAGLVRVASRKLELTEYGQEKAKYLFEKYQGKVVTENDQEMLSSREQKLWKKLINLDGFKIFLEDSEKSPLDIDVYDFYGISVRTGESEIHGRMKTINDLIEKIHKLSLPLADELQQYKRVLDELSKELNKDENKAD